MHRFRNNYILYQLKRIIIPSNVSYIGNNPFINCQSLLICCEAEVQPTEWNKDWNYAGLEVTWAYKEDNAWNNYKNMFGYIPNVEVDSSDELLASYAKRKGSCVIVKGLRAGSDFENEFQMAMINHKLNPDLDTMFLTAEHQYTYLSSSLVKELGRYHVDLTDFLPQEIIPDFTRKMNA